MIVIFVFFFFKQKTAYEMRISDWSSDVCSSDLIEKKDYSELAEYDALFIRETTAIDHHTFRFAKKAGNEGMPVIDDPTSILRCTNKEIGRASCRERVCQYV